MIRILAFAALAGCAAAQHPEGDPEVAGTVNERLIRAIDERSIPPIEKLLAPSVVYEELQFDDAQCTERFGGRGRSLDETETSRLASCITRITSLHRMYLLVSTTDAPAVAPTEPPTLQTWLGADGRISRVAMRGAWLEPTPTETPTRPPPAKPPTEITVDAPVFSPDEKANRLDDAALATAQRFQDAIGGKQPAAIEATLDTRLRFEGLAYTDPTCTKRFGAKGTLVRKDVTSFAKCLLTVDGIHELAFLSGVDGVDSASTDPSYRSFRGRLEVWVSPRQPTAIVRIVATIMAAEPDVNGEEGSESGDPQGSKEVSAAEVTRLLRHGSLEVVGDAGSKRRRAEVYLCFDDRGAPYLFSIIRRSGMAEWDARVRAQVRELAITPYTSDGKPVRACTTLLFTAKGP